MNRVAMIRTLFLLLLPALLLSACSPDSGEAASAPESVIAQAPAPVAASTAPWTLVPDDSRVSFVSVKNDAVTEVHRFTGLSGTVGADGQASLVVDLDTVHTGIEIRDQRMRELLFDTATFGQATATLDVDLAPLKTLDIGAQQVVQTEVALQLHGMTAQLPAELRVTRTGEKQWLVTSEQPLVVNADSFGLSDGIEALRSVAGLKAIASGVPVTLVLSFSQA